MRKMSMALALVLATFVGSGGAAGAEEEPAVEPAAVVATQTAMKNPELDGDAIYQRILDNRFNSYEQTLSMESGDRGGSTQATVVGMRYLNYRHDNDKVLSKTIAKYQAPQDVRHLGYLIINKVEGVDDQFIYRPSARRVRRVNLRGEAVFGTDFSFEDIIPQEFEDGTYRRLPDEVVDGVPCYVVEVIPTDQAESEYSRMVVYAHQEHYVPVRTHYWDDKEVKIKEMNASPESIKKFTDEEDGKPKTVWFAERMRMEHLKLETYTVLDVTELQPNAGLKNRHFSERELARSH